MTTSIEQWKSRAFIGVLTLISITVNASYAHVHNRYQNGSDFVQRLQQGQPPPVITAPTRPAVEYARTPQPIPVSYTSTIERPAFIPVVQDAPPPSDFEVIQTPHREHVQDAEQRLQKQERQEQRKELREEKLDARAGGATNNIVFLNTNAPETAKDSKRDKHEALSPKAKDQTPEMAREAHSTERASKDSAPLIAREQGKNSDRLGTGTRKMNEETDHTSAPGTADQAANVRTPPAKEAKTANATPPIEGKTAKAQNDIKTPPNAPSQSVMNRIRRGPATGEESGAENENQSSHRESNQQHEQNQNQNNQVRQQKKQNQQNQNNGNNGGGGRRR
jgi:hypothetical protein